jgi:Mor family transcriptional regulator
MKRTPMKRTAWPRRAPAVVLEHVNGASMMALASKYSMSHSNVCMIVHHKTWRDGT